MQIDIYSYLLVAALGLAIGSFLNVLIYRLPRKLGVTFERSFCPHCHQRIPLYLNIPVLSYLILLGRCRSCKKPISPRYPLVELLNGGLYLLFFHMNGLGLPLVVHCYLASTLLVIFFVDLEFQLIPDKVTIPGIVVGLASSFLVNPPGILNSLLGFLVGGISLLAVAYLGEWLFKKEAMGGGDIKMAAMMGAFIGWQKILVTFMAGAFIGAVVSVIWMMLSSKVRRERLIPFGPFLAMGAVIVVIYGDRLIQLYINYFLKV